MIVLLIEPEEIRAELCNQLQNALQQDRRRAKMICNFEDFCRELSECGFSMGGGNAKGIYSVIPYDWTEQENQGINIAHRSFCLDVRIWTIICFYKNLK